MHPARCGATSLTPRAPAPCHVPQPVLRRSVLYMPGSNTRALAKVGSVGADAVILDLEDAVAPSAKAEARDNVCEVAMREHRGVEVTIRVNPLNSQ